MKLDQSKKELLFSVKIEDCEVQTFRAGGKGGQHQNKTETGVRIIHRPSGAVGECREERSQHTNKVRAFRKMAESKEFTNWVRVEVARRAGKPSIETQVRDEFKSFKLKVESLNDKKQWVTDDTLKPTQIELDSLLENL